MVGNEEFKFLKNICAQDLSLIKLSIPQLDVFNKDINFNKSSTVI